MQPETISKLSPLQLELLRVYSFQPTEAELLEIKRMLAQFFAKRLIALVNQAVEDKNITEQDIEQWLDDEQQ